MPGEVKWGISLLAGVALLFLGWKVYAVLLVLHVVICLILIGVILLQSGEAADLAGAFGGSGSQTSCECECARLAPASRPSFSSGNT